MRTSTRRLIPALALAAFAACAAAPDARAAMTPLLAPGDAILAIDADPLNSESNYPGGESPGNILDGLSNTKYLNFGESNSGFIITPTAGSTILQSFQITTANDSEARDPSSFALYGTNDAIVSGDNSDGSGESWTLIDSGALTLPAARQTAGPVVSIANGDAYTSYRMLFPTVKDAGATNSMQISEIAFFQSNDGTGPNFLSAADPILAIDTDLTPGSNYPGGESPANAIDGDTGTKHLNFGEVNSGLIVTPSAGFTVVKGLQVTTANDAVERDPTGFELYGTNDPIASADNSQGLEESWTLIDTGVLDLPGDRVTAGALVDIFNDTPYLSYRIVFTGVKDEGAANSMQYAEVQLFGAVVPEPTTAALALVGVAGLCVRRRRAVA